MPNGICAIAALEYIHDKYGYHVLERALRLCVGAWEGDSNSLCGNIIRGISRIVVAFGDEIKDEQFVEKLGRYSAKEIIRTGKERRAGSAGYAEAMLLIYNQRMKFPNKMDKLCSQPEDSNTSTAEIIRNDLLDLIEPPLDDIGD